MILSSIKEQQLTWQDLQPTFELSETSQKDVDFFALQPRVNSAVQQFLKNQYRSLLVIKADNQAEYAPLLEQHIRAQQPKSLAISGVQYLVEQGDSFSFPQISVMPALTIEDNFAAKKSVASALYFDQSQLFGSLRFHPSSNEIQLTSGLVHQLNQGVLILSVSAFLAQFDLWLRLKQLLTTKTFNWYSLHPFKSLPCDIPSYPLNLKVILLGSRTELAMLAELDEELYDLADYAEIESYLALNNQELVQKWADYVRTFAYQYQFPPLTDDGLIKLYQLLVRESENRNLINISPLKLKMLLTDVMSLSPNPSLSAVDFERYMTQKNEQQNFLQEQTYADILNEQVYVATDGEMIGQINGLSVIEYPGTPISFGEPSRISCIVQFGDGEVVDVERKNELAGNIHSKGIMIAESCLASILDLPSQLPFSASIVFEQSYGEIDGDSASLAGFCVLVSALADLALPQGIAITGAIDQFGLVHAVGGVNQKIEGFFTLCARRGLTGEQGVIIPTAVLNQLSLSEEVVSAVKNNQFSIWGVDDVFQTVEILFKQQLIDMDNPEGTFHLSIARLITQRIEQYANSQPNGFLRRLFGKR